jgi:hypothetical protein
MPVGRRAVREGRSRRQQAERSGRGRIQLRVRATMCSADRAPAGRGNTEEESSAVRSNPLILRVVMSKARQGGNVAKALARFGSCSRCRGPFSEEASRTLRRRCRRLLDPGLQGKARAVRKAATGYGPARHEAANSKLRGGANGVYAKYEPSPPRAFLKRISLPQAFVAMWWSMRSI